MYGITMLQMENIHIKESPQGTFSCKLDISAEEWRTILSDKTLITPNYKYALMAFYKEPEHKASCSALSMKYYHNAKDAQRFNAWITKFGEAVVKRLNRFHIIEDDGTEHFWHVAMDPGTTLDSGLFEWTLRPEIVEAIEDLGWNKSFTWIPFFRELAEALLQFRHDRVPLVEWIYTELSKVKKGDGKPLTDYLHKEDGSHVDDIDPFSVMAIFNRGSLTDKSRMQMLEMFKQRLSLQAEVPSDFDGVPVMNTQRSYFFSEETDDTERIEAIWKMFEKALSDADISEEYEYLHQTKGLKNNLTMALFWMRPYDYLALDSRNREYLNSIGISVSESSDYTAYREILAKVNEYIHKGKIPYHSFPELSFGVWQGKKTDDEIMEDNMKNSKYSEYIALLKANHNLVLTGAPGTGKTFMARAIAKDMGAVTKFVQFHPSYDYTDFVEGLRPIDNGEGQIGFERKDGVFKSFCREAIKNLRDSAKTIEELSIELSWEDKLQQFVDDAIGNTKELTLKNGNVFTIVDMDEHHIFARNNSDKAYKVVINVDTIMDLLNNDVQLNNVQDIHHYFGRKTQSQADSYTFSLVSHIRDMKPAQSKQRLAANSAINKVERKPFVFIIDEINRGDMSKIFGELFYAIDPGYRVKADAVVANDISERVETQYQNLVPESDVFSKGFYVPDNVYILATMNDIDRSVESMDFAMRRRFSWVEVTPDDTASMLDDCLDDDTATVAKAAMDSLNKKVTEEEGLGAEYAVGPAYFLKLKDNGGDMEKLWKMNIQPLLKEYMRGLPKSDDVMKNFAKAYHEASAAKNVKG